MGDLILEKLISKTDQIPAKKGILFGYTFKTTGTPIAAYTELQYENSYPELKNSDSNKILVQDPFSSTIKIGSINSTFYFLEHDWELVPGKWIFKIKDGDRVLAQKTFTLFKP